MRNSGMLWLVLVMCFGSLSVASCGAPESSSEGNNEAETRIRSQLPEDFPADVPVYPGLNGLDVTRIGEGFEVSGFAPDSIEEIDSYYTAFLDRVGWKRDKQLSDSSSANARVFHYIKDDRGITVVVACEGEGFAIEANYKAEPLY